MGCCPRAKSRIILLDGSMGEGWGVCASLSDGSNGNPYQVSLIYLFCQKPSWFRPDGIGDSSCKDAEMNAAV
jgi:hypothetical protein